MKESADNYLYLGLQFWLYVSFMKTKQKNEYVGAFLVVNRKNIKPHRKK